MNKRSTLVLIRLTRKVRFLMRHRKFFWKEKKVKMKRRM